MGFILIRKLPKKVNITANQYRSKCCNLFTGKPLQSYVSCIDSTIHQNGVPWVCRMVMNFSHLRGKSVNRTVVGPVPLTDTINETFVCKEFDWP
jgi:hypothetical protein